MRPPADRVMQIEGKECVRLGEGIVWKYNTAACEDAAKLWL